jgi:phosphatidylethanolamine/phosphatidyl-N-methylethanolamine N-methyltransferase
VRASQSVKSAKSLKATPLREQLLFLRGLIANPTGVGAIAPSSPALARAVAAQVDPARKGPVLELAEGIRPGADEDSVRVRGIHRH